jgi:DNA-binding FadR family transcriptional regulator
VDHLVEATGPLLGRVRAYIVGSGFVLNDRLPPERELSRRFGVSRSELRRALSALEEEGLIWRHVGRGTFIGTRPVHNLDDVAFLRQLGRPEHVFEARLAIEPALARLAACRGARHDVEAIRLAADRCRSAGDWRSYGAADDKFHLAVARASRNKLLIHFFDLLNIVRRAAVWGQPRLTERPPPDHPSFAQHEAILAAICARDAEAAEARMHQHLQSVRLRSLPTPA